MYAVTYLLGWAAGTIRTVAPTTGQRYGILILLAIALLCIVREAFLVATLNDTAKVFAFASSH